MGQFREGRRHSYHNTNVGPFKEGATIVTGVGRVREGVAQLTVSSHTPAAGCWVTVPSFATLSLCADVEEQEAPAASARCDVKKRCMMVFITRSPLEGILVVISRPLSCPVVLVPLEGGWLRTGGG